MTLDYFYGQAGELFSFYRIPKALFQEPRFQSLSTDAKTLYGILLDRMSLSVKNGWLDKQNRVFILFTIEDVKRVLCCADNKATKLLRELEKFGLIERKRRGQGKPSLVYVKNFSAESSKESVKNRDNDDSCGFKIACQDPAKSRCNKTKENDTEMSETDLFYSEHPACHQLYEEGRLTSWTNAEPNAILSAVTGGATSRTIAGRSLTTE
jgi:Replication initiator protein A (RepA) N-terminus.